MLEENVGIDRAGHQEFRAGDGQGLEAAQFGFCRDRLGDVQPGDGRNGRDPVERLVNGVVRADSKPGAYGREFFRGGKHEFGHGGPVARVDVNHVLGQRVRMQGDFRMHALAHESGRFLAQGAIAQRGALGAAGHDSDVLAHVSLTCRILISSIDRQLLLTNNYYQIEVHTPAVSLLRVEASFSQSIDVFVVKFRMGPYWET